MECGVAIHSGPSEIYPIEPRTAAINSPSSGNLYVLNESVDTQFSNTEAPGGPGLASCVDSNGISASDSSPLSNLASGASMVGTGQLITSIAGQLTYGVTAESLSGLGATSTIDYVGDRI